MLKVLIVEDDRDKLRNVIGALQNVEGCSLENIDQAGYANDAKRLLREVQYDLLILDVALPRRPDDTPSPEGGLELLQEILDRDAQYYRPKHIVGLTAFPDVLQRVAQLFEEDLWMVIQYDGSSGHWAEQIQRKVRYIQLVNRSQPLAEYGVYLGVVAALHRPELAAVLEGVSWGWSSIQLPSDPSQYFRGSIQKDGTTREVVAVASPRVGMTAASVTSMKLISAFRPRYLAMVGIAAGVKGRCQLGDVVVADPSWDWGSGKIAGTSTRSRFEQAPYQVALDSFLRAKLSVLAQDAAALDLIRRSWKGSPVDHVLRMHIGPVASGAAVLADKKSAERVIRQHRKLLAIEMETYGLYEAAQEAPLPQPKVFSLKSICDYADNAKDDAYQPYASFTSAQSLRLFVEGYL